VGIRRLGPVFIEQEMMSKRCTFEYQGGGRARTGQRATVRLLAVVALYLTLSACTNLNPNYLENLNNFQDANVTLTFVQLIDSGTLLHMQDFGIGDPSNSSHTLGYAAAVAANGDDVFVVDQMSGNVLRINVPTGETRILAKLIDPATHGLFVSRDRSIFVVDKFERAVRQLDDTGRTTHLFIDDNLIPEPVDVTETNWGDIVIADALNSRLVLFKPFASVFDVIGSTFRRLSVAQTLHAISAIGNSVLVLDSGAGEVMRFNLNGNQIGNYGEDDLVLPTALAVDQCGRLFVADGSRLGLHVSVLDMMVPPARTEQNTSIPESITDMWVDGIFLYIAAGSLGISIYLIEPTCAVY